ncbi:hypothetical protein B9Z55_017907 [Caenorhabditis nigoni]|uniref:G-protein coupled receptors family 1 profile domain-containing protein n=1 Tax=Caenorhabditis nigoni TaxID=1611254 RepID=A0A2G5TBM0_9PELO|nr:hypothetical protein B9Z55_017907 [Caenorhabditis nigoni]
MNYISCFLFFIPPYLNIPDQSYAVEVVHKELSESSTNLPIWITNGPVFVLSTNAAYAFISVMLMILFIIGECVIFIFLLAFNTKCMARKMHLSKTTLRIQRKFLNALHVQMYTPLVILIVPLIYVAYSVYFREYNQAINNVCFIMISFHGLASTIIMLLIHKSYREVCMEIFCMRMSYKTTPAMESLRNSFVSHVPRTKLRHDSVIVVSHQITY